MKPSTITALALGVVLAGVIGCSDTSRSRMERTFTDKPSTIRCMAYGEILYEGRSKGKAEIDENGKLAFTDASDNQLTVVEGDCIVKYDR